MNKVVYIENANTKAGILTDVGGRIVLLKRNNRDNLLESDSSLWNEPISERIEPTPFSEFKAYNGHEVWLAPQSEWWKHQDQNPDKVKSTLFWPPDPYISYDNYTILEKTDSSIIIDSNSSPTN